MGFIEIITGNDKTPDMIWILPFCYEKNFHFPESMGNANISTISGESKSFQLPKAN
jgi:hypothetical protein